MQKEGSFRNFISTRKNFRNLGGSWLLLVPSGSALCLIVKLLMDHNLFILQLKEIIPTHESNGSLKMNLPQSLLRKPNEAAYYNKLEHMLFVISTLKSKIIVSKYTTIYTGQSFNIEIAS